MGDLIDLNGHSPKCIALCKDHLYNKTKINLVTYERRPIMAKIADKINELTGNDENTQKMREQFEFLQKMASAKTAEFKAELEKMYLGNGTDKTQVTGNRSIRFYSAQHVDLHTGCDAAIDEAVKSFFEGSTGIKNGFMKLISCALDTLIGNSSIGEHQEDMFFIYPENNAIVRIDVKTYKYSFSKGGFISNCENVFCYTMAKSIVDHTTLTKDELLYFVTQMCTGKNNNNEYTADEDKQVSLNEVMDFVKQLITIWNLLDQEVLRWDGNRLRVARTSENVQAEEPTPEQIEACNNAEGALTIDELEEYIDQHKETI